MRIEAQPDEKGDIPRKQMRPQELLAPLVSIEPSQENK